eukprot:g19761.t1
MSDASIVPGGVDSSLPEASEGPAPASITEGLAEVLPVNAKRKDGKNDVFYNPAQPDQVFNRDLSVLVLSVFAKVREEKFAEKDRLRLERFRAKVKVPEVVQGEQADERENEACKELPKEGDQPPSSLLGQEAFLCLPGMSRHELPFGPGGIASIVANDLDPNAVEHMKRNFAHNELPSHVQAVNSDANAHMYSKRAKGTGGLGLSAYDVIDLDPYGTVAPFIDSAVQAVADGGLLCITSTDMPVPVLHAFATAAARCGREVRPLLSVSIDFYVRLFVRVFDSPARVKRHASKTGLVHQCVQCESFFVQKFGEIEGSKDDPLGAACTARIDVGRACITWRFISFAHVCSSKRSCRIFSALPAWKLDVSSAGE